MLFFSGKGKSFYIYHFLNINDMQFSEKSQLSPLHAWKLLPSCFMLKSPSILEWHLNRTSIHVPVQTTLGIKYSFLEAFKLNTILIVVHFSQVYFLISISTLFRCLTNKLAIWNFGIYYYIYIKLQNHSRVKFKISILEIANAGHGIQVFSRFSTNQRCGGFFQCMCIKEMQLNEAQHSCFQLLKNICYPRGKKRL